MATVLTTVGKQYIVDKMDISEPALIHALYGKSSKLRAPTNIAKELNAMLFIREAGKGGCVRRTEQRPTRVVSEYDKGDVTMVRGVVEGTRAKRGGLPKGEVGQHQYVPDEGFWLPGQHNLL